MKSLFERRAAATSPSGSRFFQRCALGGLAAVSLLATAGVYGQGQYYPVNPPGAPYGTTYTGITVHSNPSLIYLQDVLQNTYGTKYTLQVPIPTGSSAPSTTQYSAIAAACTLGVLNASAPAGVTLTTLSNEAVAWAPANLGTTTTAIAQTIVQYNSATAVANLTTVANALALSQPTLIDSIMPSILSQAGTVSLVATGIPQLVAAAISDIPTDLSRVGSIVNNGLANIVTANLTAAQKNALFVNYAGGGSGSFVQTLLNSTAANNNPSVIVAISTSITNGSYLSLVPVNGSLTALDQVLSVAVTVLPATGNYNDNLAAVTDGALTSQSGSAAAIKTQMMTSAGPTYAAYVGAVVDGYTNGGTLAAFQAYVTGNPGYADAAASGAVTRGTLTGSVILQNALTLGTSSNPVNVVAAAIDANVGSALSTLAGAINTSTHTPYGSATFGNIALGAAEATPIANIGNAIQTIITASAASVSSLTPATVDTVVDQGIVGATSANNSGAYADIVYKAESVARNTTGASASLVTQAVDSIETAGGLPYIAAVAAAAGDIYGVNRTAIQGAAVTALNAPGGGGGAYTTAATDGMNLVQALQTSSTTTYTTTLNAYKSANTTSSDAVIADLYGAILANPSEADAGLAAAIKQSTVSDATLTTDAENALRVSNSNLTANLQMVDTVVTHIKAEAVTGTVTSVTDLFDYVSHQIVIAPALSKDIAVAATVIDPDDAHYVASAAAFTTPMTVYNAVGSIFEYAQITNATPLAIPTIGNPTGAIGTKPFPGSIGTIIDQPAAAAAITAGLTTGILEANLSTANTQTALSTAVAAAVTASLAQNGTNLRGPTAPFSNSGAPIAGSFQQSTGASPTASSNAQTVGAAGAITGYVAEVTTAGQTTISAVTAAVLTAAVGGGARPYALQIAQAAAQAFAWVSGSVVPSLTEAAGNPAYDIAEAMLPSVTGFATLTQLFNAAYFGLTQANAGVIGAGALGLNATNLNLQNGTLVVLPTGNANSNFYLHRSATGAPVTDIFNL